MRAFVLLLACIAIASIALNTPAAAQDTQFYLRAPFGAATCMNGDTGTILWSSSQWSIVGSYPTNVANTYCTPASPTIQFRQWGTSGITPAKTTGISRPISLPPFGYGYSSVTLVNISMIKARQAVGCPISPVTAYPLPSVVLEVSANSVDYVSMPFTQAISTTARNITFDVTSVLFNNPGAVVAPVIRIWNGPFAPACQTGGRLVSDVVQIQQVIIGTQIMSFTG